MELKIGITKKEGKHLFDVKIGENIADELSWEEMLGVVISLTISDSKPCLQWVKTPEQAAARKKYFESLAERNNSDSQVDFEEIK